MADWFPRPQNKAPMPVPGVGVFDTPTVVLCINSKWAGYLDGLLGQLATPEAWTGTDSEIEQAVQDVGKLMIALAEIGDCP